MKRAGTGTNWWEEKEWKDTYQLKLSSSSGCRHVLFVTRVIADIVSEHITEGEGSGSGAIEESLRRRISLAKLAGSSGDCR